MAITINARAAVDCTLIAADDADSLAGLVATALDTYAGEVIVDVSNVAIVATIFANAFWNSLARRVSVATFPRVRIVGDDDHVGVLSRSRENVIEVLGKSLAAACSDDDDCETMCPLMLRMTRMSSEIVAFREQFTRVEEMLSTVLALVSLKLNDATDGRQAT